MKYEVNSIKNAERIKKVGMDICGEDDFIEQELDRIFLSKRYDDLLKLPYDKAIHSFKCKKEDIDLRRLIKFLSINQHYDDISLFMDNIGDNIGANLDFLVGMLDFMFYGENEFVLSDMDLILMYLSIIIYYKEIDCKTDDKIKDTIEGILTWIAELDTLMQKLFDTKNEYFLSHFDKIVDINFLKKCTKDSILVLYYNGYHKFIEDNVSQLETEQLFGLFRIKSIRDRIISKKLLLKRLYVSDKMDFFLDLPVDKRELLAYYNFYLFSSGKKIPTGSLARARDELKILLKNNFPEFDDVFSKKIVNLYGNVSADIISRVLLDKEYLDKMEKIAFQYLDGDLASVLTLSDKYPNLAKKIFSSHVKIDQELKLLIDKLVTDFTLDEVDSLEINELERVDLNNYSYLFEREKNVSLVDVYYPSDSSFHYFLFYFPREVIRIDLNGEAICVPSFSYDDSIKAIYGRHDIEAIELIHRANIMGEILCIASRYGFRIWSSASITSCQQVKMLELLECIKNEKFVNISIGIAVPDTYSNFVMLHDGMRMEVPQAIEEIKRIKIDDKRVSYSKIKKHS